MSYTVLLVEDDPANVRLMERLLQQRPGVRVLTATLGAEGLSLAREHGPDLIFLDFNLPDLSGDRILAGIREDPGLRAVAVIVMSGEAGPATVHRMLELGADGYVTKPIDIHEVLRIVDERLPGGDA